MSLRRRPFSVGLPLLSLLALLAHLYGGGAPNDAPPGAPPLDPTRAVTRVPMATLTPSARERAESPPQPEPSAPAEGFPLSGSVVDATGGPVPFARVRARQVEGAQADATALSDEEGRFALSLPVGDVTVRAEADGYASATVRTQAPDAQIELKLTPEASLSGSVISALDGSPLAEIEVIAFKHSALILLDGDGRTLSAADGTFSIRGLSSGTYHVHARSPRWSGAAARTVSLSIAEPGGPVRIEARPAVSVAGTVHIARERAPCTAGTVFIGSADATHREPYAASSPIAADGAFCFSGVPGGTYTLRIECRDALALTQPTLRVADKDMEGLTFAVDQGLTLTGRVVDAHGRALADRTISIAPDDSMSEEQSAPVLGAGARSDAQGAFSAKGLAPGVYRVHLSDDEQTASRVELVARRPSNEVTLVVTASGALRVLVEGADERARARLAVSVSSQFGELPARRAADGSYLLRDLRAGAYIVSVSDGKGPAVTQNVRLADGEQSEVHIALPKQREVLSGRVVDGAGNPVSDAWVRASRSASSLYEAAGSEAVLTDSDGNFELTQLAGSETYDVEAYTAEESKTVSRGLRPGQWVTLRLDTSRQL